MSVIVKLSNGTQKSVEAADLSIKVSAFKELAADTIGIPADEQRIVFRGKILKDDDVLSAVGVEHDSVMHVVRGKKSGAAAPAPTATPATTVPATTSSATVGSPAPSASVPSAPATAPNPYAILAQSVGGQPSAARAGTGGAGASAPNPFASMMGMGMGGSGGQMPQMPGGSMEDMMALMENPMVMQQIEAMMSNPQMMEAMAQQNPALRGMSPEMLQMSMQMMRNPAMMRSMMQMMQGQQGQAGQQERAPGSGPAGAPQMPMGGANPFGSVPPGFFAAPAPTNPREAYRSQLDQLRSMGFPNEEANLSSLIQSQGNLDFAIDRLLNG